MFLFKKAEFEWGRLGFANFLNTRNLKHYAAEIGTHRGEFAEQFLDRWEGLGLSCIDPWMPLPEYEFQQKSLEGFTGNRNDDLAIARERLERFGSRATLIQETSETAVEHFDNGAFCFVYIDGNHQSPHILNDIERWWPKVGTGGILAGHDIVMPGFSRTDLWEHDIQSAVFQFAASRQIIVYLVPEDGPLPWSWYIIKP